MSQITKLILVLLVCGVGYLLANIYLLKKMSDRESGLHEQSKESEAQVKRENTVETVPAVKEKTSKSMYKWTDEKGRVHFADSRPEDKPSQINEYSVDQVQTTKFEEVTAKPVYVPRSRTNSVARSESSDRRSRCKALKEKVKRLEKSRGSRSSHSTRSHNSREQRLKDARWEVIRDCH